MPDGTCSHIGAITAVKQAKRRQCDECVKIGARWVHLRICQECGATRCCDGSPNRHATEHARLSEHPVIASAEYTESPRKPGQRGL
jgi:ubiquitin-hydrolase Zn-finger-containing protein